MMEESSISLRVWDLPTRLFHWGAVALGGILTISGKTGAMPLHALAGEICLVLAVFRMIWGMIGSRTSRFSDFLHGPSSIYHYLCQQGHEPHVGHNPLGGWMVLVLLGGLMLQAGFGLFANDDILFNGPMFHWVGKETSDLMTVLHKRLFLVLAALVFIHVGAVGFHWLVLKDNLVGPMLTGRKSLPHGYGVAFVSPWRALLALTVAAGLVGGGLLLL